MMFPRFGDFPSFFELGAWTINHIKPFFEIFRQEDVAPALALIIFGTAIGLCFLFFIETIYIRIRCVVGFAQSDGSKGKQTSPMLCPKSKELC